ncbi:SpoIID/LytB domain-containing protein [Pseudoflavonifractor sp. 60]|uniref:SpoIID/LytB domain-containing protein n=1 Tax=Pseudoflavonifractor sp. 60 TaxID=2304576 RepID=UPI00136D48D9|nr:SpoIID/LytB domain-containing protein [Pseudoflavonifractor sp. 60]
MGKRLIQLTATVLAVCLSVTCASAATLNQNGEVVIRVGLASSNSHVPTGELEAAYLESNNSEGHGSGYRFGYFDSSLNFVELARTDPSVIQVAVLKTQNLYWGTSGGKQGYYSSITSNVLVGCYHVQIPGSYTYDTVQAEANRYSGGFPAWIDGAYQVRVGAYGTNAEAQAALAGLPEGAQVVWTSAYGMNVVRTGSNQILFQYDCGASGKLGILPDVTGAADVRTWFAGYKYRGGFQYFRRTGGNLSVVNVLELEDYINGVVCYEMGRDWPLEALKAQAVCARTYVMGNLGKHNDYGFDICPSDYCQVYHGMGSGKEDYGPSETSMRAVDETAGMVVKYNGRVADVFYVSSFGGASEDAKNIWGTDTVNEYPYLRGVVDPYEADLDDRNAMSPWTVTYTTAQLTKQLQKSGLGTSTSVDRLDLTYSPLGNVIQVVVHWANGQSNTISASYIRSRFDVRSIRFTVNGAGTGTPTVPEDQPSGGADSLEGKYIISGTGTVSQVSGEVYAISGAGTVSKLETETPGETGGGTSSVTQPVGGTVTVSGSTYTFNGGGWGHQVGMSQYGANAMARRGFAYDEIVTFYFPGTQVTHY